MDCLHVGGGLSRYPVDLQFHAFFTSAVEGEGLARVEQAIGIVRNAEALAGGERPPVPVAAFLRPQGHRVHQLGGAFVRAEEDHLRTAVIIDDCAVLVQNEVHDPFGVIVEGVEVILGIGRVRDDDAFGAAFADVLVLDSLGLRAKRIVEEHGVVQFGGMV